MLIELELEEAIALLLEQAPATIKTEKIPLLQALGRIAGADLTAPMDQPPFDRSPLDGYTFAAADTRGATPGQPKTLQIIGEVCAGHVFAGEPTGGQAVRIMTGAKIPVNCDCVIRQEDVQVVGNTLMVPMVMQPFENYCFQGEDVRAGTALVSRGTYLTPSHLGVLASMGFSEAEVYRLPVVAICSTGDELADVGQPLGDSQIYNSNLYTLAARLQELGIRPLILGQAKDDAEIVAQLIAGQSDQIDLMLTTGGVSVGKMDIMHEVIRRLPAERLFWKVKMKPGTPILGYRYQQMLGIGLSGNPYAALATFELLVRPVLAKLCHNARLDYQRTTAVLDSNFAKASKGRRFIRAQYDRSTGRIDLPDQQFSSGALASAMDCNAMIDIPKETGPLVAGEIVEVVLL